MARDLVLGVDAGHTVTKAVLFDATGRPVARGSGMLPLSTPRPHWVERDMDDVWRTARQAIAACLAEAGPDGGRAVAAVGLAAHGDGLYAVDGQGQQTWARTRGPPSWSVTTRSVTGGAAACGLRTYILPAEHRTGGRGLADVLRLVDWHRGRTPRPTGRMTAWNVCLASVDISCGRPIRWP